ncbi:MAG: hypothetical protein ABI874_12870, partial [Chloroflexota bacterium]
MRRLERGWVFQRFKVVLVRAVPDVHFRWKIFAAFGAVLPPACMAFGVMMTSESVMVVVAMAVSPRASR